MEREIWLRSNWRVPAVCALLATMVLAAAAIAHVRSDSTEMKAASIAVALVSAGLVLTFVVQARRPRLGYAGGHLAVYLRGARPIRVPIETVECFFLGQGPSWLPRLAGGTAWSSPETSTLIVRLAEAAPDWKHRDVRPWLGLWCESYITIRGTCCEPLSGDLVARLNRRLVEVHRTVSR
jgi:hypothetical protein